jgi:hypothetical protein
MRVALVNFIKSFSLVLPLISSVLASCSDQTSILLAITGDPGVMDGADSIRIRVDEGGTAVYDGIFEVEGAGELSLSIHPGRDGEYGVTISAAAIKAGTETARGETAASFRKSRTVHAEIRLSAAGTGGDRDGGGAAGDSGKGTDGGADGGKSCTDECPHDGAVECTGSLMIRKCSDGNGDECLEWGPALPCGSGAACVGGSCRCIAGADDCRLD